MKSRSKKLILALFVSISFFSFAHDNSKHIKNFPRNVEPSIAVKYTYRNLHGIECRYKIQVPIMTLSLANLSKKANTKSRFSDAPARQEDRFTKVKNINYSEVIEKYKSQQLASKDQLRIKTSF
ncbi:MAG: hypothetical protein ACOVP5_02315 [Chitinophagales bacterium]